MKNPKVSKRKRKRGRLLISSELVSLRGYSVPDDAKRKLLDIWIDYYGNDAKQTLESFKLGFNTAIQQTLNITTNDNT